MITKITRGDDLGGLVRYLAGPGRSNEHTDPQVVAVSEGIDVPIGLELSAEQRQELVDQLDLPAKTFGSDVKGGYVWHLSLAVPEGDGQLTNEQWAEAAHEVSAEMGFSGDGVSPAPWVAMRHGASSTGNDHVHMAVSLVREDGRKASNWQERVKVAKVATRLEQRFGVTVVEGRTAGAVPAPTRAELEQTDRHGRPETDRARLGRTVRGAAIASLDEAEFVRRLRDRGVAVRPRFAKGNTDQVVGYSVAIAGRDQPVWFGGGTLAKDLRLPALRDGWGTVYDQQEAWTRPASRDMGGRESGNLKPGTWNVAASRVSEITDQLAQVEPDDHQAWANAARTASGLYAELSRRFQGDEPGSLSRAADTLARSAQKADRHHQKPHLAGLAAVVGQATMTSRMGDFAWTVFAGELLRLSKAISELHQARAEAQRAAAVLADARVPHPKRPKQSRTDTLGIQQIQQIQQQSETDFGR